MCPLWYLVVREMFEGMLGVMNVFLCLESIE
jgi:hypothetical protein